MMNKSAAFQQDKDLDQKICPVAEPEELHGYSQERHNWNQKEVNAGGGLRQL